MSTQELAPLITEPWYQPIGARAMPVSVLDTLDPLPAGVVVTWSFIGGRRNVIAMTYHGRSYITGEATFIIRYEEPGERDRQRPAYASDLTVRTEDAS